MFDVENFQSFIEALDGGHYWTIPNKWSLNLHLDNLRAQLVDSSVQVKALKVSVDKDQASEEASQQRALEEDSSVISLKVQVPSDKAVPLDLEQLRQLPQQIPHLVKEHQEASVRNLDLVNNHLNSEPSQHKHRLRPLVLAYSIRKEEVVSEAKELDKLALPSVDKVSETRVRITKIPGFLVNRISKSQMEMQWFNSWMYIVIMTILVVKRYFFLIFFKWTYMRL